MSNATWRHWHIDIVERHYPLVPYRIGDKWPQANQFELFLSYPRYIVIKAPLVWWILFRHLDPKMTNNVVGESLNTKTCAYVKTTFIFLCYYLTWKTFFFNSTPSILKAGMHLHNSCRASSQCNKICWIALKLTSIYA